jgi:hypothetical protein
VRHADSPVEAEFADEGGAEEGAGVELAGGGQGGAGDGEVKAGGADASETRPTKGSGLSDDGEEEVRQVIEALEAIEDPVARARAVSTLLKDQGQRNVRLKADRDQTVRDLRAEKLSLRKTAERVGLSLGSVQDILRGHSGTWTSRPPSGRPPKEEGPPQ